MATVLITGIGKGIGRALAERFLREGYHVVGTYLTAMPNFHAEHLTALPLDFANPRSIEECVASVMGLGYPIDVLINNAGVLLDEEETTVVPGLLRQTLEVNLIGIADWTERIVPALASHAHVVNISSSAGSMALTLEGKSHFAGHYPAYKISKAALNMYTVTLAQRLASQGITVSSVHPGWVRTDMGGADADLTPEEAADGIFDVATSRPETGGFWFRGERLPW